MNFGEITLRQQNEQRDELENHNLVYWRVTAVGVRPDDRFRDHRLRYARGREPVSRY